MVRTSGVSMSDGRFCARKFLMSAYIFFITSSLLSQNSWLYPLTKCMKRVTSSSPTAMLPEVSYATCTSWFCCTRRRMVPPIEMTSSSGWGENTITRFCAGMARSGRLVSSALGLPPGHPVMVCCRSLNILMLQLYAEPKRASRSESPFSL